MKQINNISAPAVVVVKHDAVSAVLSIVQVAGRPLTQVQDTQSEIWLPDRSEFPLTLEPILEIVDSDSQKVAQFSASYNWYIDEVKDWDTHSLTGKIPSSLTAAEGFYLERDGSGLTGRLVVTKNINYVDTWDGTSDRQFGDTRGPVTLYCEATYAVAGIPNTYKETVSAMLTTQNVPEEFYNLSIDAPSTVYYHPLSSTEISGGNDLQKDNIKTLKAQISKGKYPISAEEEASFKYFWYYRNDQKQDVLITGNEAWYVGGQNTNTLSVNADYAEELSVSVKIADSTSVSAPNIPATAGKNIAWFIPPIEAVPYSTSGSAVKDGSGNKEFDSIVQTKGGEISSAVVNEFVRMEWVTKDYNRSDSTSRGWGRKLNMAKSILYPNDTEVKLNLYVLGTLETVTCNGEGVTASDEKVEARN